MKQTPIAKHHTFGPNKLYGFTTKTIYVILFFITIFTIGIPIIQSLYIYPSFVKQIIENTENQAIRTGQHLRRVLLTDYTQNH
ncbi:MAG: hypothetical protein AAF518_15755, partial [Spirochaetota bacterium]